MKKEMLFFAKTVEGAVIPSKRREDAGFDFQAYIEPRETLHEGVVHEQLLGKGKVNFVRTGIASAMSEEYALSFQHERSSVAKHGMIVIAGLVDSGYRGEIQLMIIPTVKDILITSMTDEVEDLGDVILYPYEKALSQAVLIPVPDVEVDELPYDKLLDIESERMKGGWGSSGK